MLYLIQAKRKDGEKIMLKDLKVKYIGEGFYLIKKEKKTMLLSEEEIDKIYFKKMKKRFDKVKNV